MGMSTDMSIQDVHTVLSIPQSDPVPHHRTGPRAQKSRQPDRTENIKKPKIESEYASPSQDIPMLSSQSDASISLSDLTYSFFSDNIEPSTAARKREDRYSFMTDIRDKNGTRKGEPGYDPSTLHIPDHCYRKFTPFERQFWDIKKEHFDTVIMFKKGAFYELYENDAELASKLFDFRMSDRVNMRMSGFPEKSYDQWASKLLALGHKIGRVEQEENSIGKKIRASTDRTVNSEKIITRTLKEVITTGTVYNNDYLSNYQPVYLAALVPAFPCPLQAPDCFDHVFIILYDASINRMFYKSLCDSRAHTNLKSIFVQYDIREVISEAKLDPITDLKPLKPIGAEIASGKKYSFESDELFRCYTFLYNYMASLCREASVETADILPLHEPENMLLDGTTLINLDILSNNYDGSEKHSLYQRIDHCSTPFGQRLLRKWLMSPLICRDKIAARQQCASLFEAADTAALISMLRSIGDAERKLGRLDNANPSLKDLTALLCSLQRCVHFLLELDAFLGTGHTSGSDSSTLTARTAHAHRQSIEQFFDDFNSHYKIEADEILPCNEDDELFILAAEQTEIKRELDEYLARQIKRTGTQELCYKHVNREIYQIEAPASVRMPSQYSLTSSTKSTRRYYSVELKLLVSRLQQTDEKIFQSRASAFRRALKHTEPHRIGLRQSIQFIAQIDCFISFSIFNTVNKTTSPVFIDSDQPRLCTATALRSPLFPSYISNDFSPSNRITLITGPNMGGKSTLLRSICLNVILAQMGMRVLAEHLSIPIFDRIFTRIGASDSLARGESTFMMEMNEASAILRTATENSLIIMDELGRGTSTGDGEAIARAVLDHLKILNCYALFSTHYHRLVTQYSGVDKAYVDCLIDGPDIIFLYKLRPGVCQDSHGLYIARMAGIPESIVSRAIAIRRDILDGASSVAKPGK